MNHETVVAGLKACHLPASWAEWVECYELRNMRQDKGPYRVHKPKPPGREYETIEEDWWDGEEETVTYTTHIRTESEMTVAMLDYEIALHLWTERHGDAEEAEHYVAGPSAFSLTLLGNGKKLELVCQKPEQGWMISSWKGF